MGNCCGKQEGDLANTANLAKGLSPDKNETNRGDTTKGLQESSMYQGGKQSGELEQDTVSDMFAKGEMEINGEMYNSPHIVVRAPPLNPFRK